MVGKRIIIVVIAVLLCSVVNVAALADHITQYTDTGGYDETEPGADMGVMAVPTVWQAPMIYPLRYESVTHCPHCGATGSTYIATLAPYSGYQHMWCKRCNIHWLPQLGGYFKAGSISLGEIHFHIDTSTEWCPYLYGIDYGINENGHLIQFYCPIHNVYSNRYSVDELFEFNTLWGLRVVWWEDWLEPSPQPSHAWETPFVPPYDSFATLEPVSVDNVGDIVNDTAAIVKVVYRGFPYFSVLLTIAIACAFIVVVVRG